MPTNEELQQQNFALTKELMKRELANVQAANERRDSERKAAEANAKAKRDSDMAVETEERRRGAWLAHALSQQCSSGHGNEPFDIAGVRANTPKAGWPPGMEPADLGVGPAAKFVPEDVKKSSMYQLAVKRGVKF